MNSKTSELLKKLEKLDPGAVNAYYQFQSHHNIYDEKALEYILQGVICDAIAARGIYWEIEKNLGPKAKPAYLAYIWLETGTPLDAGEGATPAEAILAACVAALEASK